MNKAIIQIERRVNLQISGRFGLRLIITAVLILVFLLLCEMICRSPWVQHRIPFQAYGSNHIQFDYQIGTLKAYVDRNGAPDCFILGTSMPLRAINPAVLGEAYQELTGESLACYNFSVVGATISATTVFAEFLIQHYQPDLFIVGTNFLDFSEAREKADDSRFVDNSWFRYQLGRADLDGWLVEYSYAYRIVKLLSYGAYAGLDYQEVRKESIKWSEQLTMMGYGYEEKVYDVHERVRLEKNLSFLKDFGDFSLSRRNINGLDSLIRLAKQNQVQVVVVHMPYHQSLVEFLDDQGKPLPQKQSMHRLISELDVQLNSIALEQSCLLWRLPDSMQLSDESWLDRYHLNRTGSQAFSRWLAEKIASAVESGQLHAPNTE